MESKIIDLYEYFNIPRKDATAGYLTTYLRTPSLEIKAKLRPAVLVIPGGAYTMVSDREGEPVALSFLSEGYCAFLLKYTTHTAYPTPLIEACMAMVYIRENADKFGIDPQSVVAIGFSAGGHAAGSLGVRWHDEALMADCGLTCEAVRPNAMVLCYPVINGGEFAHRGSFVNLTGTEDISAHEAHSLETLVTDQAPPTFLWHTFDDGAVPVENTLMMASALRKHGVMTEVHIFPYGGHGLALANPLTSLSPGQNLPECAEWVNMAARFLRTMLPV